MAEAQFHSQQIGYTEWTSMTNALRAHHKGGTHKAETKVLIELGKI